MSGWVSIRWDTQDGSLTDAIKLNGIMPITFQTGQPHDHLGERERERVGEEGADEEGNEKGVEGLRRRGRRGGF